MTTAEFSVSSDSVSSNEFGPVGVVSFSAATLIGSLYCMMSLQSRLYLSVVGVLMIVSGCCSSTYRVQLLDLNTDETIKDAHAIQLAPSLIPVSALEVQDTYTADADGIITLRNVCTSSNIEVSGRSRRGGTGIAFRPELVVGVEQSQVAKNKALERWISQRRQGDLYRIPLLTHYTVIKSANDVVSGEKPEDATTVLVIGDGVNDVDLEAIKQFPNLRFLAVSSTNITEEGLLTLRQFPQLLSIDLLNNPRITEAGVDQLRVALPKTIIIRSSLDQEK